MAEEPTALAAPSPPRPPAGGILRWPVPVLHFSNVPVRAGVEEHMLRLLQGLHRKYFTPLLACPPELVRTLGADVPRDVEVFPLFLESPKHAGAARRLARALRQRHVQILHSHQFRAGLNETPDVMR